MQKLIESIDPELREQKMQLTGIEDYILICAYALLCFDAENSGSKMIEQTMNRLWRKK